MPTQEESNSAREPRFLTKHGRRIAIGAFLVLLFGTYIGAGLWYRSDSPAGSFIAVWNWWVALGIGLLATGGLSLYFYVVSQDIPGAIKDQVDTLVEQLQCPIKGYHEVTNHIIEVCESAQSYYFAATLMPLIGAIGEPHYYKRYRQALVQNIMEGCKVELVFLEQSPLEAFMAEALKDDELAKNRITLVTSFADEQLEVMTQNLEYRESFGLWRTDFIPYQVCIADGARAVLYFGKSVDLKQDSSVRAFYTEDRSVVEVLSMGFEQVREAARERLA